jgi:DnaJ-class molecular chaperone
MKTCPACNGRGEVYVGRGFMDPPAWDICLECDGEGEVLNDDND